MLKSTPSASIPPTSSLLGGPNLTLLLLKCCCIKGPISSSFTWWFTKRGGKIESLSYTSCEPHLTSHKIKPKHLSSLTAWRMSVSVTSLFFPLFLICLPFCPFPCFFFQGCGFLLIFYFSLFCFFLLSSSFTIYFFIFTPIPFPFSHYQILNQNELSVTLSYSKSHQDFDVVQVSLAFGLAVFVGAQVCGPISGGYMNPAVVIGGLVARRLSVLRSILFVAFQIIGAIGLYTEFMLQ